MQKIMKIKSSNNITSSSSSKTIFVSFAKKDLVSKHRYENIEMGILIIRVVKFRRSALKSELEYGEALSIAPTSTIIVPPRTPSSSGGNSVQEIVDRLRAIIIRGRSK